MARELSPTLLDQLLAESGDTPDLREIGRAGAGANPAARIEGFNERDLAYTVRRELAWLLNTIQLGSRVDLDAYPEVRMSVLNYGVADMSGHATSSRATAVRAASMRQAIGDFEPRIDPYSIRITPPDPKGEAIYLVSAALRLDDGTLDFSCSTALSADAAATVRS